MPINNDLLDRLTGRLNDLQKRFDPLISAPKGASSILRPSSDSELARRLESVSAYGQVNRLNEAAAKFGTTPAAVIPTTDLEKKFGYGTSSASSQFNSPGIVPFTNPLEGKVEYFDPGTGTRTMMPVSEVLKKSGARNYELTTDNYDHPVVRFMKQKRDGNNQVIRNAEGQAEMVPYMDLKFSDGTPAVGKPNTNQTNRVTGALGYKQVYDPKSKKSWNEPEQYLGAGNALENIVRSGFKTPAINDVVYGVNSGKETKEDGMIVRRYGGGTTEYKLQDAINQPYSTYREGASIAAPKVLGSGAKDPKAIEAGEAFINRIRTMAAIPGEDQGSANMVLGKRTGLFQNITKLANVSLSSIAGRRVDENGVVQTQDREYTGTKGAKHLYGTYGARGGTGNHLLELETGNFRPRQSYLAATPGEERAREGNLTKMSFLTTRLPFTEGGGYAAANKLAVVQHQVYQSDVRHEEFGVRVGDTYVPPGRDLLMLPEGGRLRTNAKTIGNTGMPLAGKQFTVFGTGRDDTGKNFMTGAHISPFEHAESKELSAKTVLAPRDPRSQMFNNSFKPDAVVPLPDPNVRVRGMLNAFWMNQAAQDPAMFSPEQRRRQMTFQFMEAAAKAGIPEHEARSMLYVETVKGGRVTGDWNDPSLQAQAENEIKAGGQLRFADDEKATRVRAIAATTYFKANLTPKTIRTSMNENEFFNYAYQRGYEHVDKDELAKLDPKDAQAMVREKGMNWLATTGLISNISWQPYGSDQTVKLRPEMLSQSKWPEQFRNSQGVYSFDLHEKSFDAYLPAGVVPLGTSNKQGLGMEVLSLLKRYHPKMGEAVGRLVEDYQTRSAENRMLKFAAQTPEKAREWSDQERQALQHKLRNIFKNAEAEIGGEHNLYLDDAFKDRYEKSVLKALGDSPVETPVGTFAPGTVASKFLKSVDKDKTKSGYGQTMIDALYALKDGDIEGAQQSYGQSKKELESISTSVDVAKRVMSPSVAAIAGAAIGSRALPENMVVVNTNDYRRLLKQQGYNKTEIDAAVELMKKGELRTNFSMHPQANFDNATPIVDVRSANWARRNIPGFKDTIVPRGQAVSSSVSASAQTKDFDADRFSMIALANSDAELTQDMLRRAFLNKGRELQSAAKKDAYTAADYEALPDDPWDDKDNYVALNKLLKGTRDMPKSKFAMGQQYNTLRGLRDVVVNRFFNNKEAVAAASGYGQLGYQLALDMEPSSDPSHQILSSLFTQGTYLGRGKKLNPGGGGYNFLSGLENKVTSWWHQQETEVEKRKNPGKDRSDIYLSPAQGEFMQKAIKFSNGRLKTEADVVRAHFDSIPMQNAFNVTALNILDAGVTAGMRHMYDHQAMPGTKEWDKAKKASRDLYLGSDLPSFADASVPNDPGLVRDHAYNLLPRHLLGDNDALLRMETFLRGEFENVWNESGLDQAGGVGPEEKSKLQFERAKRFMKAIGQEGDTMTGIKDAVYGVSRADKKDGAKDLGGMLLFSLRQSMSARTLDIHKESDFFGQAETHADGTPILKLDGKAGAEYLMPGGTMEASREGKALLDRHNLTELSKGQGAFASAGGEMWDLVKAAARRVKQLAAFGGIENILDARADGGALSDDQVTVVGERGPEIIFRGKVYPNSVYNRMFALPGGVLADKLGAKQNSKEVATPADFDELKAFMSDPNFLTNGYGAANDVGPLQSRANGGQLRGPNGRFIKNPSAGGVNVAALSAAWQNNPPSFWGGGGSTPPPPPSVGPVSVGGNSGGGLPFDEVSATRVNDEAGVRYKVLTERLSDPAYQKQVVKSWRQAQVYSNYIKSEAGINKSSMLSTASDQRLIRDYASETAGPELQKFMQAAGTVQEAQRMMKEMQDLNPDILKGDSILGDFAKVMLEEKNVGGISGNTNLIGISGQGRGDIQEMARLLGAESGKRNNIQDQNAFTSTRYAAKQGAARELVQGLTPERFQAAVIDARNAEAGTKNVGFGQLQDMLGTKEMAQRVLPMLAKDLNIDPNLIKEAQQAVFRGQALGVTGEKKDLAAEVQVDGGVLQSFGQRITEIDEMFSKLGKTTEMLVDQKHEYARELKFASQGFGEMNKALSDLNQKQAYGHKLSSGEQALAQTLTQGPLADRLQRWNKSQGIVSGDMSAMMADRAFASGRSENEIKARLSEILQERGPKGRRMRESGEFTDMVEKGYFEVAGRKVTDVGVAKTLGAGMRAANAIGGAMFAGTMLRYNLLEPANQAISGYLESQQNIGSTLMSASGLTKSDLTGSKYDLARRRSAGAEQFSLGFGQALYNNYSGVFSSAGNRDSGNVAGDLASIIAPGVAAAMIAPGALSAPAAVLASGAAFIGTTVNKTNNVDALSTFYRGASSKPTTIGGYMEDMLQFGLNIIPALSSTEENTQMAKDENSAVGFFKQKFSGNENWATQPITFRGTVLESEGDLKYDDVARRLSKVQLASAEYTAFAELAPGYTEAELQPAFALWKSYGIDEKPLPFMEQATTLTARGLDAANIHGAVMQGFGRSPLSQAPGLRALMQLGADPGLMTPEMAEEFGVNIGLVANTEAQNYTRNWRNQTGAGQNRVPNAVNMYNSAFAMTMGNGGAEPYSFAGLSREEKPIAMQLTTSLDDLTQTFKDFGDVGAEFLSTIARTKNDVRGGDFQSGFQTLQEGSRAFSTFQGLRQSTYGAFNSQTASNAVGMAMDASKSINPAMGNILYGAMQGDQLAMTMLAQTEAGQAAGFTQSFVDLETGQSIYARGINQSQYNNLKEKAGMGGADTSKNFFTAAEMAQGTVKLEEDFRAKQHGYQMAGYGIQAAQARTQFAFMTGGTRQIDAQGFAVGGDVGKAINRPGFNAGNGMGMWQVQDAMTRIQREKQDWGMEMQAAELDAAQRGNEMQIRHFNEKYDMSWDWMKKNIKKNRIEMNVGREIQVTQRGWQADDMSLNQATADLQFGWGQQDFNRNVRYARGRERQDMIRENNRSVTMFSISQTQRDREKERFEQTNKWADERFDREKAFFKETNKHQKEEARMEKRHFMERMAMEQERLDRQKKNFEKELEWMMEQRKLEDQSRLLERQQAIFMHDFHMASIGVAAKAAEEAYVFQEKMNKMKIGEDVINGIVRLNTQFGLMPAQVEKLTGRLKDVWAQIQVMLNQSNEDPEKTSSIDGPYEPEGPSDPGAVITAGSEVLTLSLEELKAIRTVLERIETNGLAGDEINISTTGSGIDLTQLAKDAKNLVRK